MVSHDSPSRNLPLGNPCRAGDPAPRIPSTSVRARAVAQSEWQVFNVDIRPNDRIGAPSHPVRVFHPSYSLIRLREPHHFFRQLRIVRTSGGFVGSDRELELGNRSIEGSLLLINPGECLGGGNDPAGGFKPGSLNNRMEVS